MEIVDYALSDDIKKQLGFIIREIRKFKFQDYKNEYLIENNPYTKENFCENNQLCHYHTLTKLESEDAIKENYLYHLLLNKLDLSFQVGREEHKKNMDFINSFSDDLLKASEYIDDEKANHVKRSIQKANFENDCIANLYYKLINVALDLQLLVHVEVSTIDIIDKFVDFFEGTYKGLALQCVGIYKLNNMELESAISYFTRAKEVYDIYYISSGLINSYLIPAYTLSSKYLEGVRICLEMENYYLSTGNFKRLMHVYNYLSDYYLLINAENLAQQYFVKSIEIINKDKSLERFKYYLYFNWGLRCFKDFRLEEALDNFKLSYEYCNNNVYRLQIINFILIVLTKMEVNDDIIMEFYLEGEKYFSEGNDHNQKIFRYFRYKIEKNKYYRRYALEKIIPKLKCDKNRKEVLIFFYEDLYKKL